MDTSVRHKDIAYILRTGGLTIFLSLMAIAANAGNIFYSSIASVGFVTDVRKNNQTGMDQRGNHEALQQKKGKYYVPYSTQFD